MANYLINRPFSFDDFIRSYEIIRSRWFKDFKMSKSILYGFDHIWQYWNFCDQNHATSPFWGVHCFDFWEPVINFVSRISRRCFDLKLGTVLILRSRHFMKRDLCHWTLHKILKKKHFINFPRQFTLRDHAKFLWVFSNFL